MLRNARGTRPRALCPSDGWQGFGCIIVLELTCDLICDLTCFKWTTGEGFNTYRSSPTLYRAEHRTTTGRALK